ncbi:hypothetical protein BDZ91DRAFT_675102, partial [Kalaharituber pfeilii]
MEPASTQLSRPLPRLVQQGTTSYSSVCNIRLSRSCMHLWTNFAEDVCAMLQNLNLTGMVSVNDGLDGEVYYVGNELGLTGRFLNSLRFSDYHAANLEQPVFPDVVIVNDDVDGCNLRAVGEIKTFWTFHLHRITVSSPDHLKVLLEAPIGQVVAYMRASSLRYGFLSTYYATVFIRRMDNYRFDLSPPILWNATQPSVRECFFALGFYTIQNCTFLEQEPLNVGVRPLPLTTFPAMSISITSNGSEPRVAASGQSFVTPMTIFLGSDSKATRILEATSFISGRPPNKAVLHAVYQNYDVVLKFWPEQDFEYYMTELDVYLRLESITPPDGLPYFARLVCYGDIICSSLLPKGYAIVMTKLRGEPFSDMLWRRIGPHGRFEMTVQLREAIGILRSLSLWNRDASKRNVLYDMPTGGVALVDFEQME